MSDPRIIVALDFATPEQAIEFCGKLDPSLCRVKVGLELYLAGGQAVVARLQDLGFEVFLDLKFHDIPNTVAQACKQAAALGVWMINVHTLGGADMMQAAREAIAGADRVPLLIGVTVLTSMSASALQQVGVSDTPDVSVERLAGLARQCGLDGVVCSPREAASLRQHFGKSFLLVTPGIRMPSDASDDQSRTLGPAEAMQQGSSHLVIGRPITRAPDPRARLGEIHKQLNT